MVVIWQRQALTDPGIQAGQVVGTTGVAADIKQDLIVETGRTPAVKQEFTKEGFLIVKKGGVGGRGQIVRRQPELFKANISPTFRHVVVDGQIKAVKERGEPRIIEQKFILPTKGSMSTITQRPAPLKQLTSTEFVAAEIRRGASEAAAVKETKRVGIIEKPSLLKSSIEIERSLGIQEKFLVRGRGQIKELKKSQTEIKLLALGSPVLITREGKESTITREAALKEIRKEKFLFRRQEGLVKAEKGRLLSELKIIKPIEKTEKIARGTVFLTIFKPTELFGVSTGLGISGALLKGEGIKGVKEVIKFKSRKGTQELIEARTGRTALQATLKFTAIEGLATGIIVGGGAALKGLKVVVPGVSSVVETGIGGGLGLFSIVTLSQSIPKIGRKGIEGSLAVGETIAGGLAGLGSASIIIPKARGFLATVGRKKIDIKQLVPEDVLSGKKRFPIAGKGTQKQIAQQHKKLFEASKFSLRPLEKPSGFHATTQAFFSGKDKVVVQKGKDLFISPAVSPAFLGTGESPTIGLIPRPAAIFRKPAVLRVTPKGFQVNIGREIRVPTTALERLRTGRQRKTVGFTFKDIPRPGFAQIPGQKTEIEAIIQSGSELTLPKREFFSIFQGVRFPIDELILTGSRQLKNVKSPGKMISTGKPISYSGLPTSLTPSGSLIGLTSISISRPVSSSVKISESISISKISKLSKPSISIIKTPMTSISDIYKESFIFKPIPSSGFGLSSSIAGITKTSISKLSISKVVEEPISITPAIPFLDFGMPRIKKLKKRKLKKRKTKFTASLPAKLLDIRADIPKSFDIKQFTGFELIRPIKIRGV